MHRHEFGRDTDQRRFGDLLVWIVRGRRDLPFHLEVEGAHKVEIVLTLLVRVLLLVLLILLGVDERLLVNWPDPDFLLGLVFLPPLFFAFLVPPCPFLLLVILLLLALAFLLEFTGLGARAVIPVLRLWFLLIGHGWCSSWEDSAFKLGYSAASSDDGHPKFAPT